MPNTYILIRCKEYNERVGELISGLKKHLPGWTILAISDALGLDQEEIDRQVAEFPVDVLTITDAFLDNCGLHRAPKGTATGWLCGDYVLYRALERNWDFAWVIEPDVFFLNGAEDILRRLQKLDHDLLATRLWPTSTNWMWGKALENIIPGLQMGAMSFPMLRASRRLAEDSLQLRKEISSKVSSQSLLPNDEVVVATAARINGRTILDIMSIYEEVFTYFGTETKKNVDDLQQLNSYPLVVHAGRRKEEFLDNLHMVWNGAFAGNLGRQEQLLSALRTVSNDTMIRFVRELLTKASSK